MTQLPTYDEIVTLHKKYAPTKEGFDLVFTHCLIVNDIAQQFVASFNGKVDENLVRVGCLLHDIGVYRLFFDDGTIDHKNYIKHGTLGYELLREEGFDDQICKFASHHTGVGLGKDEIIREDLPLPHDDFYAESVEEEIVMYSDKFHTKTNPPKLLLADTYAESLRRFGEDKVEKFHEYQKKYGTPSLELLAQKYHLIIE